MSTFRRRLMMSALKTSLLPDGYIQCEYIESLGSSYIDTGVIPTNNTRVVLHCLTATTTPSSHRWILGSRTSSSSGRFEVINISTDNSIRFYFNKSNGIFTGVTPGELFIDVSQLSATVNGASVTPASGTFTGTRTLWVGDCNSDGSDAGMPMKIYSCQIYDNGLMVRDYIPCSNSENVYGLYDLIGGEFYESGSSVTFSGPSVEVELPDYSSYRGVFIEDSVGFLYAIDEWDGSRTPNGYAVLTNNCRIVLSLSRSSAGYRFSDIGSYSNPGVVVSSNSNTAYADYNGESNSDWFVSTDSTCVIKRHLAYTFPNGNIGYCGSAGEWNEVIQHKDDLLKAMDVVEGSYNIEVWFWTSTLYSISSVWYANLHQEGISNTDFLNGANIWPFTKLKSEM